MTATLERQRLKDAELVRLQYRGSDDALIWTEWRDIPNPSVLVEWFEYYQGRAIFADGSMLTSPIETDMRRRPE